MSLVVADEAEKVRRKCGGPDTTELPADDLNAFFTDDALEWINRRRPGVAITSFTTVAGTAEYDEKPANAYHVDQVWWRDVTWQVFSATMEVVPGQLDVDTQMAGISIIDNPSIVKDWYAKIRYYEDFFTGYGEETEEGEIRLVPEPTASGDSVYFSYTYPRWDVVTSVPDQYVEAVRHFATHCALEYLAMKRGVVRGAPGIRGGGGDREEKKAREYLERAEGLVPIAPAISVM